MCGSGFSLLKTVVKLPVLFATAKLLQSLSQVI